MTARVQSLKLTLGLTAIAFFCPAVYSCAQTDELDEYGDSSLDPPPGGNGGTGGEDDETAIATTGGSDTITATIGAASTTESSGAGGSTTTTSEASTTVSVTTAVTTASATTGGTGGTGGDDACPDDPDKTEEGECGCGTPDTDSDSDTTPDCNDGCPDDEDKTEPGSCGCGVPDDAACMALADALIHRYSFDGTGTTAEDSVGNADGTLMGGATQSNGSVALSGSQYVELPSGLISGHSAVTIEFWFNWGGGDAWQRVFDFGISDGGAGSQGAGESYVFFTPRAVDGAGSARAAFTASGGPANEVFIDAAYPSQTGTTVHAAVTVSGSSIALYTNGAIETSSSMSSSLSSINDENNWLGWSQFEADPGFQGNIHEFRIYDTALSAGQISTSYGLGLNAPLGN